MNDNDIIYLMPKNINGLTIELTNNPDAISRDWLTN